MILGAQATLDIGANGARDPVEHLVAVARDLMLDAVVQTRPPLERKGRGQANVIVDGPRIAAIGHHGAEAGAVEAEAFEAGGVGESADPPTRPLAPASLLGPA